MTIRTLDSSAGDFEQQLLGLLASTDEPPAAVREQVGEILAAVRDRGDAALLEYTRTFDQHDTTIADLEVSADTLAAAVQQISPEMVAGFRAAADRIRAYHERQKAESWSFTDADGSELGQQVTPLDRVGVYVPGGKAAYPSSVLMNVIPAQVAGVPEIIMVVPAPGGQVNPAVLAAAHIVGVDRVFAIGGAQAVAALAYGTGSVPRVDKIVGPGNIYVATAKRMVFGTVGIDMIAGPSEVLVVCDNSANPDWIAMDMFAQAEHDEDACALLLCPDTDMLTAVQASIERLLPELERADIIRAS
ncbi:MAG: histidinol dehydrogenase, partial [Thiotrichales bacterium]|nr:histidinol dehydrogenase [Thiotrichales bacterium]